MFIILNQLPYPLDSFPERIYRAAEELASNVQVTNIIAGTSCLTALSTTVSPLVDWRHPLSGQIRPCVLYQAIVAISGDRKSSAEQALCAPIYEHDVESIKRAEAQALAYNNAKTRWRAVHKRALHRYATAALAGDASMAEELLSSIESQEPKRDTAHRIIGSDTTKHSILEALDGDGKTLALLTDEGQTLLNSTVMRHYGFLNNTWDGKPLLTLDRAGHESLVARNPRVTVSFMIQPDVLAEFFSKRGKVVHGSGFCARFLFSRSPTIQGLRPPKVNQPFVHLLPFHERLHELLSAYTSMHESGRVSRDVVEFDEQAKLAWLRVANTVETEFRPGYSLNDISDFGNKYMDIIGRIACLLHYFETGTSCLPEDPQVRASAIGKISLDTFSRASNIAAWHLNEYKEMFSKPLPQSPEQFDANKVYSYLHQHFHRRNQGQVPKNHVLQYSGVRNSSRLNSALQILQACQAIWVTRIKLGDSKRESEVVTLNRQYFDANPTY